MCLKSWQDYLFGDATYQLNKQRQVNLRKPSKLPLEEDLVKLRDHLIGKMKEICGNYHFDDAHSYIELRNAASARLTLLNGCRGGEPCRLLLDDWKDAESNACINP